MATLTKVIYFRNKAIFNESAMSNCYKEPQFLLIGDTALTDKEIEKLIGKKASKILEDSVDFGLDRFTYYVWAEDQNN